MRRDAGDVDVGNGAVWSRRRDEITFDRLRKFWHDLPPQARRDLLKLDKQTLIEDARKNSYCSRCNGLLLDCFARVGTYYDKSLRQEEDEQVDNEQEDAAQDPSVHPWGGLSATKDDVLTLADRFVNAESMCVLQNVFDNALARERERRKRYPYACGAGGRGCGTRERCALHTARPSCDALVDFWAPLGDETRSSLLRMREEDFVEKLTRRFNRKKFCRDCRKNVIREFKELKEPKRVRRERRCNCWFCADNGFQCEVVEDGIIVDWSQCLSAEEAADGSSFHHFEWAVGTREGDSDIFGFEDVGTNARVHKTGINPIQFEKDCFVTLRAWRSEDRCTQYCVRAHVLMKGESSPCVVHLQHTLVVSDGFVIITGGGSMRSFFERAAKVEEEDEDAAGENDLVDADGSHTQKHAKSPELAREFLLDSASVIFKEQVVKAFRDGTAQENARSVFVSLALKLLEERVHVACKELITLEKQNKLLEEEEKEMREVQERRTKRKTKEREKKHRQKQKLKGNGKDKGAKLVDSKSPDDDDDDTLSPALMNSSSTSTTTTDRHESTDAPCSTDSPTNAEAVDQPSCRPENKADRRNRVASKLPVATDRGDCCCASKEQLQADSQYEPAGRIGDSSQWQQSMGRKRRGGRSCSAIVPKGSSARKNTTIPKQVWQQPLDDHCRAKQCFQYPPNCQVRHNNVNRYLTHHPQCPMHPEPVQKTAASFNAMPPSTPCRNGAKQITGHPMTDMNLENKLKPLGQKDIQEGNNGRTRDSTDASFSLFQFSLPIASPVLASSQDDRTPLVQVQFEVQAQLCSREQTDVKEYKLFSTNDGGLFPFMQIE